MHRSAEPEEESASRYEVGGAAERWGLEGEGTVGKKEIHNNMTNITGERPASSPPGEPSST